MKYLQLGYKYLLLLVIVVVAYILYLILCLILNRPKLNKYPLAIYSKLIWKKEMIKEDVKKIQAGGIDGVRVLTDWFRKRI